MRTKTIILSAVALAAGLLSSHAQVYSANIVGYVNRAVGPHFNDLCNPLDANGSNSASNVIPNVGPGFLLDGCAVLTWNGFVFTTHYMDSTSPTLWTDSSSAPEPAPVLAPGTGWLFDNTAGLTNMTFVGTVAATINGSSISNSMVLAVPPNVVFNLIGPKVPVGGRISSDLQLTNTVVAGVGDRDGNEFRTVNIVNTPVPGSLGSYTPYFFDSSVAPPYITDSGGAAVVEPQISITHPFLYLGSAGSPPWIQKY